MASGSHLASDLVALAYLAGVVAVARLVSIAYAVPLAMPLAEHVRELGLFSAVGAPIEVEGRLWGGLVGLQERLATHDGRLRVESPVDGGTLVSARIPLEP